MDGRWTGCGRAGAAEIAWEEARDGGARANVRIRWTGGGRAVDGPCTGAGEIAWEEARDGCPDPVDGLDGLWTGGSCRNSMGGGGWAVDGLWMGGSCRNSVGGG